MKLLKFYNRRLTIWFPIKLQHQNYQLEGNENRIIQLQNQLEKADERLEVELVEKDNLAERLAKLEAQEKKTQKDLNDLLINFGGKNSKDTRPEWFTPEVEKALEKGAISTEQAKEILNKMLDEEHAK
ncbi:hypothetical protein C1645_841954 [Glomus cerebriforme]|uniref:Uncharacterized protein n=1 Tax=Glomus cerebriforme TaxID=658196 RepID=A0A397S2J8_9GLOM|nr:hypothetical protein C1645_841954 [Glomus cerebriforme]